MLVSFVAADAVVTHQAINIHSNNSTPITSK